MHASSQRSIGSSGQDFCGGGGGAGGAGGGGGGSGTGAAAGTARGIDAFNSMVLRAPSRRAAPLRGNRPVRLPTRPPGITRSPALAAISTPCATLAAWTTLVAADARVWGLPSTRKVSARPTIAKDTQTMIAPIM
eukprot:3692720-Prymnesium_polylepis.1